MLMSKVTMIDIRVPITDNEIKKTVIDSFTRLQAKVQVSTTRDLTTVITVTTSIINLLKAVFEFLVTLFKPRNIPLNVSFLSKLI